MAFRADGSSSHHVKQVRGLRLFMGIRQTVETISLMPGSSIGRGKPVSGGNAANRRPRATWPEGPHFPAGRRESSATPSAAVLLEIGVERGKRQALPLRQLQVMWRRTRITGGRGPAAEPRLHPAPGPSADSKPRKVQQKRSGLGLRDPSPSFVHYQDVSHLEPPQAGNHGLLGAHPGESQAGIGVVFILKGPAGRDGCIENEGHQDLRPSSRAEKQFANRDPAVRPRSSRIPAMALSISS